MLIVYAETSAHIDVLYADAMAFQLVLQFVDAITECLEVTHVENLRTDVEMQSHEFDVLQLFCLGNHGLHVAHGDAELVLGQSRGDVGMGVGAYIGIQSECHAGHLALLASQFVDDFQLWDALHIKAENIVV